MGLSISFRHMESSPALEAHAKDVIVTRIQKFVAKNYSAAVSMEVDRLDHIARCHVHVDDHLDIQLEQREPNMYTALDLLGKKLDQTLARLKERRQNRRVNSKLQDPFFVSSRFNQDADDAIDAEEVLAAEAKLRLVH